MGHYVKNNLVRNEQVEYETDYHWIIFLNLKSIMTLFLKPIMDRWCAEFAITNRRVIIKTGFISRRSLEMNLDKIESVAVDQSVMGRLLGYGHLQIIGSGGTRETFYNISQPLNFRKRFQELSSY